MPFREGRSATMLRATGITKTFPGVKSLDHVDFAVEGGEILTRSSARTGRASQH